MFRVAAARARFGVATAFAAAQRRTAAVDTASASGPSGATLRFSRATTKEAQVTSRLAQHPSGSIIEFDTATHQYLLLPKKTKLRSVTALLRAPLHKDGEKGPPVTHPFDLEGIAAKVAEREGKTPEAVKKDWRDIAEFGTKFHDYISEKLLKKKLPGAVHWTAEEVAGAKEVAYQKAFDEYWAILQDYGYELNPCGSEMIVASPKCGIAGTIDCLLKCPAGNSLEPKPHMLLVDWKTNKAALRGQTVFPGNPTHLNWPFEKLPAVKLSDYSLQLNAYRRILETERYVKRGTKIKMAIAQFIQQPTGEVEVDGIQVEPLDNKRLDALFAAAAPVSSGKKPFA
ncbi:hypothetical protein DIPPA_33114 [Diplonema papillatum]|nr:hypothetical protein DIPPA_33114 [Diplonema papillatum]